MHNSKNAQLKKCATQKMRNSKNELFSNPKNALKNNKKLKITKS